MFYKSVDSLGYGYMTKDGWQNTINSLKILMPEINIEISPNEIYEE